MEENNQFLIEKSNEIKYTQLNFNNQLKILEIEKRRLLKQITSKRDSDKIGKIKKEINESYGS